MIPVHLFPPLVQWDTVLRVNPSHSTVGKVWDCSQGLKSFTVSPCRGDGLGQSLSVEWDGMYTWQTLIPKLNIFGFSMYHWMSVGNGCEAVESETGIL